MSKVKYKHPDRYPFKKDNAKGRSKKKGLRRQVKDGIMTKQEAWDHFSTLEYKNPKFYKWLHNRSFWKGKKAKRPS